MRTWEPSVSSSFQPAAYNALLAVSSSLKKVIFLLLASAASISLVEGSSGNPPNLQPKLCRNVIFQDMLPSPGHKL